MSFKAVKNFSTRKLSLNFETWIWRNWCLLMHVDVIITVLLHYILTDDSTPVSHLAIMTLAIGMKCTTSAYWAVVNNCYFNKLFSSKYAVQEQQTPVYWPFTRTTQVSWYDDDVHPGRAWSSSPACTWHCSLHSLSPGKSLVSSWCDHIILASLLWQCLTVTSLLQLQEPMCRTFWYLNWHTDCSHNRML